MVVSSDCAYYLVDLWAAEWASMSADCEGADTTVESRSWLEFDLSLGTTRWSHMPCLRTWCDCDSTLWSRWSGELAVIVVLVTVGAD